MRTILVTVVMCVLMSTTAIDANGDSKAKQQLTPSAEDLKVIALLELLQMMDLAEDMEMVKALDYLIEDPIDEQKKN